MLVLGINKILNWCHITSGGRNYTCPTKLIDGKLFFHFKKEWYSVAGFLSPFQKVKGGNSYAMCKLWK